MSEDHENVLHPNGPLQDLNLLTIHLACTLQSAQIVACERTAISAWSEKMVGPFVI